MEVGRSRCGSSQTSIWKLVKVIQMSMEVEEFLCESWSKQIWKQMEADKTRYGSSQRSAWKLVEVYGSRRKSRKQHMEATESRCNSRWKLLELVETCGSFWQAKEARGSERKLVESQWKLVEVQEAYGSQRKQMEVGGSRREFRKLWKIMEGYGSSKSVDSYGRQCKFVKHAEVGGTLSGYMEALESFHRIGRGSVS